MADQPILHSDIVKDDGSISGLIELLILLNGNIEKSQKNIKSEAAKIEKSLEGVTGATVAQREQIRESAKNTDALASSYRAYDKALSENNKKIQELRLATKKLNELRKNEARLALSAEGSYNQLAAQYNIIKLNLNAMSKAQREGTEEGRKLVKVSSDIYKEMKRLQSETGKNVLNVGNYAEALEGTTKNLGELQKELTALKNLSFEGKSESEIEQINRRIGELKASMSDLREEQNRYSTDTATLTAGTLTAFAAGIEGIVSSVKILGLETPALEGLQNNIVELIAITQSLSEIEEALSKKTIQATAARIRSAAITAKDTVSKWANNIATAAAVRAETARAVAVTRGNIATRTAAAVQWAWNAALAANPIGLVVAGVAALAAGIVILANSMGESKEQAEKLNGELDRLRTISESNEDFRQFQLRLANESGKTEVEKTRLTIKLTKERISEINKEKDLLFELAGVQGLSDDQRQRGNELSKELIKLKDDLIVLGIRETNQIKEQTEEERKAAKQKFEDAKKERERREKEAAATQRQRQDARIKELEEERNFQLAKFDSEIDYSNQSADYQQRKAIERLLLEQKLNTEILEYQKQIGRITAKEFETQILNMKAAFSAFEADIKRKRAESIPSLLSFDISKQQEENVRKRILELSEDIARKTRIAIREKENEPSLLMKLFGLDEDEEGALKEAISRAQQYLSDFFNQIQKVTAARVQASDRAVSAAENEYNRQVALSAAGRANSEENARRELKMAEANQKKALEQQRRAQRQQLAIQSAEQAANLVTAVSSVYSDVPFPFNIAAALLMLGSFAAAKVKAIQATKTEFAHGGYEFIGGGSHASGNDTPLGFSSKGKPAYAERGEFHGIVRKQMVPKYRRLLPTLIDSLNAGNFEERFLRISAAGKDLPLVINSAGTDTRKMERQLSQLVKQGGEKVYQQGGKTIIRKGSWTTSITGK